jgi:hypothetical protein
MIRDRLVGHQSHIAEHGQDTRVGLFGGRLIERSAFV